MTRDIRKMALYQSDGSYRRTLKELERRARTGVQLQAEDSDEPGNKFTTCTLGLCDRTIHETMMDGVYRSNHHNCPHDGRYFNKHGDTIGTGSPTGCFFKCHIFKGRKVQREDCVTRINKALEAVA